MYIKEKLMPSVSDNNNKQMMVRIIKETCLKVKVKTYLPFLFEASLGGEMEKQRATKI